MQGEVDARGKSAGGRNLAMLDKAGSADEVDGGIVLLHLAPKEVMGGRGLAVKHAVISQHGSAGANRHRKIGVSGIGQQPFFLRLTPPVLCWNHDDLRFGGIVKCVVGDDSQTLNVYRLQ